jgi:hypothetical protein
MSEQSKKVMGVISAALVGLLGWAAIRAQESRPQQPKLKPAPMDPGPLGPAGYLTLAPMDDRPAVGQFAQMIGAIADHRVTPPPRELLGQGAAARIEQWLRAQNYSKTDALIVSVDLLAFGGRAASPVRDASLDEAKKRLEFFRWFRQKYPRIPVYAFGRVTNERINQAMLDLVKAGVVNEMIHHGAEQDAIPLISRAVLDKFAQKLRVAVVYSSEKSREAIAPAEDRPLERIVESQIRAAGGIPASEYDRSDYTLFVNAPGTSDEEFDLFLKKLIKELKEVRYIALADLRFPGPHHGGADERIIAALKRENLLDRFAGYAASSAAGAALGAAISQANMRVFYKTRLNDSAERAARAEAAHLEFLLHRYAGDYLCRDLVRPVNGEVEQKLRSEIEKFFAENFQNRTYTLAYYNNVRRSITLRGLKDLKIHLPPPGAVEIVIECRLDYATN